MRVPIKSLIAVVVMLLMLSPAHADDGLTVANDGITIAYKEPLQQLTISPRPGSETSKNAAGPAMQFDAFGRRFDVRLEENRSLLSGALQARLADRFGIYRGAIDGIPDSWVRIVVADGQPRGMLWDGSELFAIDLARDASSGVDTPIMFRLSDLEIPQGVLACSDVGVTKNAGELAQAVLSDIAANASRGPGATQQIEVAVIADFEFTSDKGAGTDGALLARMNNVDGIFSAQLGVQLNVARIDSFPANNDPFTDQLDSGILLDELTDYRDTTPAQYANGLSHLFTGRDLDTTTVGIAYTGALCSRRFGAGLTQGTHDVTTDSLIAAHELGHNFGAPHDGTSGSACEAETGDFLMATRINGSDEFSSCSIAEMQDDVSRASCISPLPSTDVALLGGSQSAVVLLGDTTTVTFDANSVGTETATNVSVAVTIPPGVTLNSATSTSGSCTTGAGTASCAIGTIAAGTGATVTLTAAASSVGTADFVATVTAATDANSNNNQATVQLSVDPAVDLISTVSAAAQVALNGSTTLRPSVENRASIAATGVSVTVTPDAGINIDSASWPAGACTISANVATCQASSLASLSTTQLQIGVTGSSTGVLSYDVNASSAETDRNFGNNGARGQLTVGSGSTGSSGGNADSGGGALDWLLMLLLLAGVSRQLRRS